MTDDHLGGAGREAFAVPVVDLDGMEAERRLEVAAAIDRACVSTGFFAIRGHGVSATLVDRALATAVAFFELPLDAKLRHEVAGAPGVQRGYARVGAEAQAAAAGTVTPPDLSETFAIGPIEPGAGPYSAPTPWPERPVEFRSTWTQYRRVMDELSRKLLRSCATALGWDAATFDELVTAPIGATRANHYPAIGERVGEDQWRGGAHTDYGTLTVLATDDQPGLEILIGEEWRPVAAPPGTLLVNIGDLLALMSGHRWNSTWHRVAVPTPPAPARITIAHFQFPNHDARIVGLDRTAGEYLAHKLGLLTAGSSFDPLHDTKEP